MTFPERVRGRDGKSYPYKPLTPAGRNRLIGLAHALSHEGRSVRQVVAELAAVHGVTRSVGSVAAYLTDYRCPDCSGVPNPTPEQSDPKGPTPT